MVRYKDKERAEVLAETRRKLLEAATAEFALHGYERANINRISLAAGYAKGTIYNHFESKRAIMLALIQEISAAHLAFIAETVRQKQDAGKRLERFFEAGFDFIAENLQQAQVMVNNLYGPDPEFKMVIYQAYLPMFDLVDMEIVALGIEQGLFRNVEPTSTAAMLMNIYLGLGSQVNEEGKPWQPVEQVVDFVLNGLKE